MEKLENQHNENDGEAGGNNPFYRVVKTYVLRGAGLRGVVTCLVHTF